MKQKIYQQFVLKIHSSEILKSQNKNLIISLKEARANNEIISLADSNVLRSIDELNGLDREITAARVREIRKRISELNTKTTGIAAARNERRRLYAELDEIQFKPDYVMIVMDKASDFDKLNKGFSINSIEFRRLVGTSNGVKQSTVVYCSVVNEKGVHIYEELEKRLNGGRDESKELIPAKFEAYKSLACSASVPVSMPKDILVVDDFVLNVKASYIQLEDSETSDEPVETYVVDGEVELNASDGFGLMCPELAKRWSAELGLDYVSGGMCIRNLFCKGMTFTFDFHEFARRYYASDTIVDVWGTVHNIEDIELIVPVSVVKLWDSYNSLEHYLECCREYHHGFAVTKTCEKELENEHTLNYQFIQSYDLSDDEIRELIMPTVNELKETICGDPDKTILFLRGACTENYKFDKDDNFLAKALMIEPRLAGDPYIISYVKNMLDKKVKQAKIGKLKVHGNFCVIGGDPFAFCQSIFKCDVPDDEKGLLKAGEMFSKYWIDDSNGEGKRVVCFRAPMSCHNNIRAMNVVHNDDIDYWYQYMSTVNIINCHDMFYPAENGADNDGDAIFTTDNKILLDKWRNEQAILCIQKKGQKSIITPESLAESNKNGFGDIIGAITNRVTAMYDVKARFPKDSEQYKTLKYRIKCGQQYQQAAIDRVKGIAYKLMPKRWYDWHSLKPSEDDDEEMAAFKKWNDEIIADKKPYFMIYVYDDLKKETTEFVETASHQCYYRFKIHLNELLEKTELSEKEENFFNEYRKGLSVSDGKSTMNRLCHMVERMFEDKEFKNCQVDKSTDFKKMLMSGCSVKVTPTQKKKLSELYARYLQDTQAIFATFRGKNDKEHRKDFMDFLAEDFQRQCADICPDKKILCDALLDICYTSDKSKKFVWDMCGEQIVENLLNKRGEYSYYVRDDTGNISYRGNKYKKITCTYFEEIMYEDDFETGFDFGEDEDEEDYN